MGRKRFSSVEVRMKELAERARELGARLMGLVDEDARAYQGYMEASRAAKEGRPQAETLLREAALRAALVPMESARASLEAMELALEAAKLGNPVARTDACVAVLAGHAAVLGACLNVRVNLPSLSPQQQPERLEAEAASMEKRAASLLAEAMALCRG